jgi:N-acetylneuraminic acid mutarotase
LLARTGTTESEPTDEPRAFIMKMTPLHSSNRSQLRCDSFLIAFGRHMALLLLFLGAALPVQPCAATPFEWEFTGNLNTPRFYHTATLLSDGRVLVASGATNGPQTFPYPELLSAELYDPATGTWTFTGSLNNARVLHTATLLLNGKVLVAGGFPNHDHSGKGRAELYDPTTGNWTPTGSMNFGRTYHTATLLFDGRVLVVGSNESPDTAELYDSAMGTWTLTGSLNNGRYAHTATLLPNSNVLITGGWPGDASAELYDPATGNWTVKGSLNTGRYDHTATLLANGTVLVAGGMNDGIGLLASAEVYEPATGNWKPTGSLNVGRRRHSATLLSDGRVLVAGGVGGGNTSFASAEIYNPATGTWTFTGGLNNARCLYTATLLSDGRVLVAGGKNNDSILASAEVFNSGGMPTPTPTPTTTPTPTATPGPIQLTGQGKKVGGIDTARLKWRGATSTNVDVYRDGDVVATTPNNGLYDDSTGATGQASFAYNVCEAGTQTCSNTVTVNFGP